MAQSNCHRGHIWVDGGGLGETYLCISQSSSCTCHSRIARLLYFFLSFLPHMYHSNPTRIDRSSMVRSAWVSCLYHYTGIVSIQNVPFVSHHRYTHIAMLSVCNSPTSSASLSPLLSKQLPNPLHHTILLRVVRVVFTRDLKHRWERFAECVDFASYPFCDLSPSHQYTIIPAHSSRTAPSSSLAIPCA